MRRVRRIIGARKTTAYYVGVILALGLSFGLAMAAATGGGVVTGLDPQLERALHNDERVVSHGEPGGHEQSALGDLLFGKQAQAHAGGYCGHDSRYVTINGTFHKQVFVEHTNGSGGHRWKGAHFFWSGTGYVRSSPWSYESADCH